MKNVAIIGSSGYVGSELVKAFSENSKYDIITLNRQDPIDKLKSADIIIYTANPAKRFKAENNPIIDFEETVEKFARFFNYSINKRIILISSLSCRTQLNTNYGRNRRACELLATSKKNNLVMRLGPLFGGNRTLDTLHDIIAGKQVFVSEDTLYAYTDIEWAAHSIIKYVEHGSGIIELGPKNSVRLGDIRDFFNSKTKFTGFNDTQIPIDSNFNIDANLVFDYAIEEKNRIHQWLVK